MAVVRVEILVKAQQPANERGTQQYDIITIQPANHLWGKGDLRGRFLFCMELDLPCGADFGTNKRCSQCEYQGIDWESESLSEGMIGYNREACPVQKYQSPDAFFVFHIDAKGMPYIQIALNKKRKYRLDYSSILSSQTITEVENESAALSIETVDSRLLTARKKNNMISESVIMEKV